MYIYIYRERERKINVNRHFLKRATLPPMSACLHDDLARLHLTCQAARDVCVEDAEHNSDNMSCSQHFQARLIHAMILGAIAVFGQSQLRF